MPSFDEHEGIVKELVAAMRDEFEKGRHVVVSNLALKAVEHAIEMVAARANRHLDSHLNIKNFAREQFDETFNGELAGLYRIYDRTGYRGQILMPPKRTYNVTLGLIGEVGRKLGRTIIEEATGKTGTDRSKALRS